MQDYLVPATMKLVCRASLAEPCIFTQGCSVTLFMASLRTLNVSLPLCFLSSPSSVSSSHHDLIVDPSILPVHHLAFLNYSPFTSSLRLSLPLTASHCLSLSSSLSLFLSFSLSPPPAPSLPLLFFPPPSLPQSGLPLFKTSRGRTPELSWWGTSVTSQTAGWSLQTSAGN